MHRLALLLSGMASVIGALLLSACGGDDEKPWPDRNLSTPMALAEHVVWLDKKNHEALLLDVGKPQLEPRLDEFSLPGEPLLARRRFAANELLVLTADNEEEVGRLAVLGPRGVDRVYDLGSRFDAFVQSDDGAYAVAFFSAQAHEVGGGSLLFNPNEIAIIDLGQSGNRAVAHRTLRSFGGAPRRIEFSPPMLIAGEERRLMAAVFNTYLALLDLEHLDRSEFTVELSTAPGFEIGQLRWSAEEQRIYVLATQSSSVYVVSLLPSTANQQHDFTPSLNILGEGQTAPTDLAVYGTGSERRLLMVGGSRAQIVEASSSRVTTIPLAHTAHRILLFEGTSPFSSNAEPRALLLSSGSQVTFLDLVDAEERTTRNLDVLSLPHSISSTLLLSEHPASFPLILMHPGGSLSLLDLEDRTVAPISARVNLGIAIPSLPTGKIWVAPRGQRTLGYLNLDNLHPGQVHVDLPIDQTLVFTEGQRPRVVLTHDYQAGAVSVLSADNPNDTSQAVTLEGFFYRGVLDR